MELWPHPQQPYHVQYFYIKTPRHIRMIESGAQWFREFADGWTARIIAWCESKKTRYDWPSGYGEDVK